MGFFIVLIVVAAAIGFGALYYLVTRFRRFGCISKLPPKRANLIATLAVLCLLVPAFFSTLTTIVGLLHLTAIWFFCDLISHLIEKWRKRSFSRYYSGVLALILTAGYLVYALFSYQHIARTEYILNTQKDLGQDRLRIVLLADAHLGELLSGQEFAEQLQRIEGEQPDMLVISGDFVDDDTTMEDLLTACRALGNLKTTYGTYFVFGNHDKGYYNEREFSEEYLREQLQTHRVTVLEDESVLIHGSFYLIGRQDRQEKQRTPIGELVAGLDPTKYMIVLNHQPDDYKNEADAKVDLVLSGHTHGGHIFPLGVLGYLAGSNDKVYGHEHRGNTDFIVTSGIAGWGIPMKTGAISEFVVIDIQNAP